jgi:hypothetical protein
MKCFFKYLLCLTLLPVTSLFASDPPSAIWSKTFGGSNIDIAHSVQQTSDSGFIFTGFTRSLGTQSQRRVLLMKTDKNGIEQWFNTFGGNNDDEGYSVQQTTDGGYIISGYTKSFGAGVEDVYLIRTDSLGNMLWSKTFGGTHTEIGFSVLQTADGGFIVAGYSFSFAGGGSDIWIIRTDPSGTELWRKSLGGLSGDGARCIQPTDDGGYILTGWTSSYGPSSIMNAWLVKTDSLANIQWHKAFGGSGVDRGFCVKQTSDKGYILTGNTDSFGNGLDDLLLVKTDLNGNQEWLKTFGGTGRDYGHSVIQTSDGGFLAAGYTVSFGAGGDDVYLVKTDPLGTMEWSKTFGGSSSEIAYSVKETFDGGCIIAGHTLSFGAGLHDVYLVKTSIVNIPVELISFNGLFENGIVKLSWVTASETNNSGFEIERKLKGIEWEKAGFVEGYGTTTDYQYYSFNDFNVQPGSYLYRLKQVDYDGSYEYSGEIEIEVVNPVEFSLNQNYPNPFNPSTIISWQSPVDEVTLLKVYDVLGNEVAVLVNEYKPAGSYKAEFTSSGLASGVYFYRLKIGTFVQSRKMILIQ